MNSQQVNSTQASTPVAQPTKKRLAIIDPSTGKDILRESVNEETPPTKVEEYGYPTALQSVSANPAHDMRKQVPAGQPGMYQSSGGMPSGSPYLDQPNMTGPAPSPQQSPIVNPSQQLNRAYVANISYYTRNNVQRTVPNLGRNNMSTVENLAQQQAASQYSHMQIVTSHPMHPAVAPLIVNTPIAAPMYQHNRYPAAYPGAIMNTPPQIYSPYIRSYFNNTSHGAANGYYPHHQISYAMNSLQVYSTQASTPVAQPTKKRLAIIDPSTGKDLLQESVDEETTTTKVEVRPLTVKELRRHDREQDEKERLRMKRGARNNRSSGAFRRSFFLGRVEKRSF